MIFPLPMCLYDRRPNEEKTPINASNTAKTLYSPFPIDLERRAHPLASSAALQRNFHMAVCTMHSLSVIIIAIYSSFKVDRALWPSAYYGYNWPSVHIMGIIGPGVPMKGIIGPACINHGFSCAVVFGRWPGGSPPAASAGLKVQRAGTS